MATNLSKETVLQEGKAGFLERFGAHIIDAFIFSIAVFLLQSTSLVFNLVLLFVYYTYMESSKYQATLGKKILNIKVTDENGEKLTYAHATKRALAKLTGYLLSIIFIVSSFMVGFRKDKNSIHDLIAKTQVVKA